ncbi:hypothetical protein V8F06_003865 [Rhypophila decipiens]
MLPIFLTHLAFLSFTLCSNACHSLLRITRPQFWSQEIGDGVTSFVVSAQTSRGEVKTVINQNGLLVISSSQGSNI